MECVNNRSLCFTYGSLIDSLNNHIFPFLVCLFFWLVVAYCFGQLGFKGETRVLIQWVLRKEAVPILWRTWKIKQKTTGS